MDRVESSPENCGSRINRDQAEVLSRAIAIARQMQILRRKLVALEALELLPQLRIGI